MVDMIIGIIGGLISLGGLVFSVLAWREAGSAKDAAVKAAQGVKRQSIAQEIVAICQRCRIGEDIGYDDIRIRYNDLNDGIQRISGLYMKQGMEDQDCKKILEEKVLDSLEKIEGLLITLDPSKQNAGQALPDKFYFYQFSSFFSILSGHLNLFRGALERQLIEKN